ncbi:MAG: sensor histidine kinase [Kofleriaceae bacterium]|nr:sensor histidine kinase [Kofleriaceae bacterium]
MSVPSAEQLRAEADARLRGVLDRLVLVACVGTALMQIVAASLGTENVVAIIPTLLCAAAAIAGVVARARWTPSVYLAMFFAGTLIVTITNGPLIQLGALSLASATIASFYQPRRRRRVVIAAFALATPAVGLVVTHTHFARPPVIPLGSPHTWAPALVVCAFALVSTALLVRAAIQSQRIAQREMARALEDERAARRERAKLDADIAQARRVDLIVELAAEVGKDIGAALESIAARAAELSSELTRDDARACLADVITVAASAGSTMRSLTALDAELAAPEGGADAGRVIRDLPRIVRRMLPTGIRLDVSADVSAWTSLGSTELLRVVSNLVINARDAIPAKGTIQVSVSATPTHVHVDVVDDGAGMDAETRSRVFEPFFTTKPVGRGTGLGLTTARALVERAGGSITLDSAPGKGTHFGLVLPRAAG